MRTQGIYLGREPIARGHRAYIWGGNQSHEDTGHISGAGTTCTRTQSIYLGREPLARGHRAYIWGGNQSHEGTGHGGNQSPEDTGHIPGGGLAKLFYHAAFDARAGGKLRLLRLRERKVLLPDDHLSTTSTPSTIHSSARLVAAGRSLPRSSHGGSVTNQLRGKIIYLERGPID
eukprot:2595731-Pyramimonas_sp.AAC.1